MCATRGAVSSRPLMPDQILPNHAALERILYDPPSRSRPVTRRTAAARGTRQARRHCHSTVNARGGTLRGEWQCGRYVQARVEVRLTLPLGIERTESARPRGEWQCGRYAQGRVEVWFTLPLDGERTGRNAQGRVAVRKVRPGPSGSATDADGAPKARVAVRLTLPLGIERTESARPRGEWQCAWRAQGRVEVWFTLPLDGERTGRNAQGRVAVRPAKPEGPGCSGPCQPFYKQCWYRVARPMEGCLLARGGAGQLACPRATRPPFPKHGRGRPCAIPTSTSGGPPRTRSRSTRSRRCQVRCDTNRRACSHASSRTP